MSTGAFKAYQAALVIAGRLAAADPANAGWQYDLGISSERIGDILMVQGKLDEALRSYEVRHAIISRLAAADPANAGWQRDLVVSHVKLAQVAGEDAAGRDEARGHWRRRST
jgi:hypothetical protein